MNTNLETITVVQTPVEGQILRARLESAGIDAFLADEVTVGMAWHLNQAIGGIKLQVRPEDASHARMIIEEGEPTQADDPEDDLSLGEAEALSLRALRAGFLGLVFQPLALYALWLAYRVFRTGNAGQPGVRGKAVMAVILGSFVVQGILVVLISFWLGGTRGPGAGFSLPSAP